jgi:hypothetical protein
VTTCTRPNDVTAEDGTVRTFGTCLTTMETSAPDPEYRPPLSRLTVTGYVAELEVELLLELPVELLELAPLRPEPLDELLDDPEVVETGSSPIAVTVP